MFFYNLEDALSSLPQETIFIIATPPEVHEIQINKILKSGRNIFVEKPGFIKAEDIKKISTINNFKKYIVYESFMHRHTNLFNNFMLFWKENNENVTSVICEFFIPDVPKGTFRDNLKITSSCLYDIGCYGLSLINEIGICLDNIKLIDIIIDDKKIVSIKLGGKISQIYIEINFGIAKEYKNIVELKFKNNESYRFHPFFKGIKEKKFVENIKENSLKIKKIDDCNGFEVMFNSEKDELILNQKLRFEKMYTVTKKLNTLEQQIKNYLK